MMNKYFLNFLRWLTHGELSDSILKKSYNHKIEDGKYSFNFKAEVNAKDWRYGIGSCK